MNILLKHLLRPYMAPAGDDGAAGGSGADDAADRGDDFVPTGDDADDEDDEDAAAAAKEAADKEAADKAAAKEAAAKEAAVKEAADKAAADKDDPDKDDPDKKDDKGRKDTRMPISRHKEILERERAERTELQRKLAQYEQGDRIGAVNESIKAIEDKILKLDEEYTQLVTDGDHKTAAAKMREIRALERQAGDQKVELRTQAATSQAVEKVRYDMTVDRLEAAYPVLDPNHDEHDPDAAQDVLDLSVTYRRRGMTPAEALQKAAVKLLGAEGRKQEQATSVKARPDKDDVSREAKKAIKEGERRQEQVATNVATARKQPADTSKLGADSDRAGGGISAKDVMRMTQKDFDKLDEETLAKMRGDTFA